MSAIQCQSCGRSFIAAYKDHERCPLCGEWAGGDPAPPDVPIESPRSEPLKPRLSGGPQSEGVDVLAGFLRAALVLMFMGGVAWVTQSAKKRNEPAAVPSNAYVRVHLGGLHSYLHLTKTVRQGQAEGIPHMRAGGGQDADIEAVTPAVSPPSNDPTQLPAVKDAIIAFRGRLFADAHGTWSSPIGANLQAQQAIEWEVGAFDRHRDEARLRAGLDRIYSAFVLGK